MNNNNNNNNNNNKNDNDKKHVKHVIGGLSDSHEIWQRFSNYFKSNFVDSNKNEPLKRKFMDIHMKVLYF